MRAIEHALSDRTDAPAGHDAKGIMLPEGLTWDGTIGSGPNSPNGGSVRCFASDGDDLYIGGDFLDLDTVRASYVVHYNRATKILNAMDLGLGDIVQTLAVHNGKLYAGGHFIHAGSSNSVVNHIAVWDGTKWSSLGGGIDGYVNALTFIGDTLYAGGNFAHAGSNTAYNLASWDGTQWSEAGNGTSYPVYALLATHDSLFVGGDFQYVGSENQNTGQVANGVAMLRQNVWTTFGSGMDGSIWSLALFKGKLWAGGTFFRSSNLLYCISSWDGATWNSYGHDTIVGTNATGYVNALLAVGDTLFALGNFSSMAGVSANGIARIDAAGNVSPAEQGLFGYGMGAFVFDGKMYVGGLYTQAGGILAKHIATRSQGLWAQFGRGLGANGGWESDQVRAIAVSSRYVFIGGNFTTIAGMTCNHVAAWDKLAKQWITLGAGVDGWVSALAVQGNNLIVGGMFNHAGTVEARHIASCNITTRVWSPMGTGVMREISALATDGTNIYAPAYFEVDGIWWTNYLGKWDGSNWSVFGNGIVGYINAMCFKADTLFAGGSLLTSAGISLNDIAQLQSGTWGALNNGVSGGPVEALAVSGNKLFVGGWFTAADNQSSPAFASWDGSSWQPIGSGFDDAAEALVRDGKGGIYIGGRFSTAGSSTVNNITEWNAATSTFEPVAGGVNNTVSALAIDTGALFAGGWMSNVGPTHIPSYHIAELKGAGAGVSASASQLAQDIQIYPNPAHEGATVSLDLTSSGFVSAEVFNSLGERVTVVSYGRMEPGQHELAINTSEFPNGIYLVRISAPAGVASERLAIQK
ncbi:MAG: T9SS type A sorting domain-containing protein [Bacteroidota bacterium]|nr:T9SS type A sorting domain-containing protein [Bacteroidota bacterium]MDP4232167.1 T9SS type A sorting domain-containing protein [Bacteroidota bacterium]MDP4241125.1 T9SS type A sorting domain-containing protein [Bacteroidota bacterium]MDP4286517.1 T9SS type A sorting domain-containing protein [Bacteroidota bacterium]